MVSNNSGVLQRDRESNKMNWSQLDEIITKSRAGGEGGDVE